MTIAYVPTADDASAVRRALAAGQLRHPLLVMVFAGAACVAVGGALMAGAGSVIWAAIPLAAVAGTWGLLVRVRGTASETAPDGPAAARAFDNTVYRVDVSSDGLTYARGPFRASARWSAFDRLVETDDHLILLERRSPGAMAYGLAKRELDRAGGAAAWRDELKSHLNGAKRRAGV